MWLLCPRCAGQLWVREHRSEQEISTRRYTCPVCRRSAAATAYTLVETVPSHFFSQPDVRQPMTPEDFYYWLSVYRRCRCLPGYFALWLARRGGSWYPGAPRPGHHERLNPTVLRENNLTFAFSFNEPEQPRAYVTVRSERKLFARATFWLDPSIKCDRRAGRSLRFTAAELARVASLVRKHERELRSAWIIRRAEAERFHAETFELFPSLRSAQ